MLAVASAAFSADMAGERVEGRRSALSREKHVKTAATAPRNLLRDGTRLQQRYYNKKIGKLVKQTQIWGAGDLVKRGTAVRVNRHKTGSRGSAFARDEI